jgi:ABC-type glutathione transport system ATPase component
MTNAATTGAPMLTTECLSKSFTVRAGGSRTGTRQMAVLDNINFEVGESEFVSLLGASGCGKTGLTIWICGGVRLPTSAAFSGASSPPTAAETHRRKGRHRNTIYLYKLGRFDLRWAEKERKAFKVLRRHRPCQRLV